MCRFVSKTLACGDYVLADVQVIFVCRIKVSQKYITQFENKINSADGDCYEASWRPVSKRMKSYFLKAETSVELTRKVFLNISKSYTYRMKVYRKHYLFINK